MSESLDIRQELIRSVISVVRHKEFYGHIVQQFEKVFVDGEHPIKTAAVGRAPGERFIKLFYNEDYFRGLYDEQFEAARSSEDSRKALYKARLIASGATEHEILHVVFDHLSRKFPDKLRGAIAMDCVVNPNIPEERRHSTWIMPKRYGFPDGQTSKWYYDHLKGNQQFEQDRANGVYGHEGVLSWLEGSHEMWDNLEGDTTAREFIKDVIRKAKENTSAEGWGKVGANIKEQIDKFLTWTPPKIPWSRVFRNFCASAEESLLEYTMSRESRRFGTRPGTRKRDRLRIAVIVDTSGSIDEEQLKMFFNEVRWIWRNGAMVHVFEADTDVKDDYEFRGEFTGVVHGRGGTNLQRPLEEVDPQRFDCIVYCTDFQAGKITRRFRTPVLWVLSNAPPREHWPCTWGHAAIIDDVA
jgi:predicted metal-dependent peptidase